MKKLTITLVLILASVSLYGQRPYYKRNNADMLFSYQVGVHAVTYGQDLMVGVHIGGNFAEVLDLTYFLVRDYTPEPETMMDTKWSGLSASLMLPVAEKLQLGPMVRTTSYKGHGEKKVFLGIETRMELNWNTKLAFFYGKGRQTGSGVKLIWNLY